MTPIRVLFLGTGTMAHALMAAAVLRWLGKDDVEASHAGPQEDERDPLVMQVLTEIGIELSQQQRTCMQECQRARYTYVVSLCDKDREACPTVSDDVPCICWHFPMSPADDHDALVQALRKTRRELCERIWIWLLVLRKQRAEHNAVIVANIKPLL